MESKEIFLSLIVPCYNEAENVEMFYKCAKEAFSDINFEIIFINDGSSDATEEKLRKIIAYETDIVITLINFSRNYGKESAMFAGMQRAVGVYTAIIDADLQQPLNLVKEMAAILDENLDYDVVAAYQEKRHEKKIIGFLKKQFYKIINCISEVDFYQGASDFRLFRRNVRAAILELPESNRFSKGIFSWIGFKTLYIPYEVRARNAGKTSWSVKKLFSYAASGIIAFSTIPLRIATVVGVVVSAAAFFYMIFVIVQKIIFGIDIPGYATLLVIILLLGGTQNIFLGILGEYIAKIHIEVKDRPIYIAKSICTGNHIKEDLEITERQV